MIRIIILAIIFSLQFSTRSYSQDGVLFKIVTFSDGVNIDGRAIKAGQDISGDSKRVAIPSDGYLGVITEDGLLYELRTSIDVAEVNRYVKSRQPVPTGATTRQPLLDVRLDPAGYQTIIGDTLFFTWDEHEEKNRVPGISYQVTFGSKDRVYDEIITDHNWILFDMKQMLEESSAVGMSVISNRSREYLSTAIVRKNVDEKKIRTDIERIDPKDIVILCAVLDINHLRHDRNFVIYKIITRNVSPNGLPGRYIARLTSQVDMK